MKLAEALQLRADLQKRMAQLADRLYDNATVQEGEQPAEDPKELLAEYEDCIVQLEDLMARINRTNCETRTPHGTLTELLAHRDCLKMRVETYRNFLTSASSLTHRATRSEIRIMSAVSVPEYRKKADALARELRETDNVIQSANWTTELL
jgi:uncharacterized coiled-coil DUF342 family protein